MHRFTIVSRVACSSLMGYLVHRYIVSISVRQRMEDEIPDTIPEKKDFLLRHRIAVWDVIHSCTIEGSSDSSIRDVVPNDISMILEKTQIKTIFTNGGKAHSLYEKYMYPVCGIHAVKLPSTSPANAAFSLERLEVAWQAVRERL